MKKKHKLVALAVVLVAAGTTGFFVLRSSGAPGVEQVRTVVLEKGDLVESVSLTGTVYSCDATEVYTALTYPVEEVNVVVGDYVTQGDVLARLDTTQLELDIAQSQASLSAQQQAAQQKLSKAQRELEVYEYNTQNEYNAELLAAQSSVAQAELGVQSSSSKLWAARKDLREAKEEGDTSDQELTRMRSEISLLEIELEKAQTVLELAEKDLEAAKVASGNNKTTYEDQIRSAEIDTNFTDQQIAIQKMRANLENSVINAPVSGVVTAVKAVKGAPAGGLLFVIQDADNLRIVANIKEYDIQQVDLGDKVEIKTDATGDEVFTGELHRIAPTSTTSAGGEMDSSNDAEFESEIRVSAGAGLRIGMNARLEIITQQREDVLFVPFEALVDDSFIYILRPSEGEEQGYIARAIPVILGLETDFHCEVSGDGLRQGDIVIVEDLPLYDGMPVAPAPGSPVPESAESEGETSAQSA